MMKLKFLTGIALTVFAFSACNDDTLDIGASLTQEADKLDAISATFNVTTRTIVADSVLTRGNSCYLGKVIDPETNASISSDFMTQLHILETFKLPIQDSIFSRENGQIIADSCVLTLYLALPATACDTTAAMKMRVYEMGTPMEEGREYYSNYDPVRQGLLRNGGLTQDKMFTYTDLSISCSEREDDEYYSNIRIPMNMPYTDREGVTYKNYGTYIIHQYYQHPEYFKDSYSFIHKVCPGFFCEITDGYGFHSRVPDLSLRVYYNAGSTDSTYLSGFTLAGTDEVLQATRIANDAQRLAELAEDNSCTYIKSPAGLFTEVTLPVNDIMQGHDNDSLLAAKISFQRINNKSHDSHSLAIPTNLLMVPKDSLYTFFEKRQIFNNLTTFGAQLVSSTNLYTFTNISSLIMKMEKLRNEGLKTDPEWTKKHPDWNKVVLVPVTVASTTATAYSASVITSVSHSMSISSTKLVGGSQNPYDPIQLNVVYAKFKNQ